MSVSQPNQETPVVQGLDRPGAWMAALAEVKPGVVTRVVFPGHLPSAYVNGPDGLQQAVGALQEAAQHT